MFTSQASPFELATIILILSVCLAVTACLMRQWRLQILLQGSSLLALIAAIAWHSKAFNPSWLLVTFALGFFYFSSFSWQPADRLWHKPIVWLSLLGLVFAILAGEIFVSLAKYHTIIGERFPSAQFSSESLERQGIWLIAAFNILAGLFWLGSQRSKS